MWLLLNQLYLFFLPLLFILCKWALLLLLQYIENNKDFFLWSIYAQTAQEKNNLNHGRQCKWIYVHVWIKKRFIRTMEVNIIRVLATCVMIWKSERHSICLSLSERKLYFFNKSLWSAVITFYEPSLTKFMYERRYIPHPVLIDPLYEPNPHLSHPWY